MEDDQGSLVRRQPAEATVQLVAIDDRTGRVDGDRFVVGLQVMARPMPATPSRLVHAGADEQAMQPGIETVRVAERGEIPPGTHERFLDRVLGPIRFVEDQPGAASRRKIAAPATSAAKAS